MHPDKAFKLITTWDTRFCPHIVHLAKMSRLKVPKIHQMYQELYKESLLADDNDGSDDDTTPPKLPSSSEF